MCERNFTELFEFEVFGLKIYHLKWKIMKIPRVNRKLCHFLREDFEAFYSRGKIFFKKFEVKQFWGV